MTAIFEKGAFGHVGAAGAFLVESLRRKKEREQRLADYHNRPRDGGEGEGKGGHLTGKQIAKAYQAAMSNFKAKLQQARALDMSAAQAAQLQADVAKSGKIGASLGVAEGYIKQKVQEQAERDAAYRAWRVEETTYTLPPPVQATQDNIITRFLGNKYTPVASAAVGVLCTDGLTLTFPHLYPAWYFIGRLAMVTSLASTGYQAREGLHGTTMTDFYLSLGMTVIGLRPGGPDIAMAHAQFFYAVYTTWIRK